VIGSGCPSRLYRDHDSWKAWTLGGTVIGCGIRAQESCCGLEGAALEVESRLVLWHAAVNGRGTMRVASGRSPAPRRPMVYLIVRGSGSEMVQGCETVSLDVPAGTSDPEYGSGMADADGTSGW